MSRSYLKDGSRYFWNFNYIPDVTQEFTEKLKQWRERVSVIEVSPWTIENSLDRINGTFVEVRRSKVGYGTG